MTAPHPDARDLLRCALALIDAGARARHVDAAVADLYFTLDAAVVVIAVEVIGAEGFDALIARLAAHPVRRLDVVLLGGDTAHFEASLALRSTPEGRRAVGVTQVTDEGVRCDVAAPQVKRALDTLAAEGAAPRTDDARTAAIVEALTRGRQEWDELHTFQQRLAGRPAVVTWAVIAACVALFVVKLALPSDLLAVDVRLGAFVPDFARGEPWRLLSYAFLHGGFGHLAGNMVSLASLGSFYERLLGRARYTTLYALAALGGALGSWAFGRGQVMVGASGALWGLLGVSFALALRPGDTLPAAMLKGFQRNAVTNLGLQVLISTQANVSWQAHLGGGVVGFALMLAGVLRPPSDGRASTPWRALSGLSLAAMVCAVLAALATGRAWELRGAPTLTPRAIAGTPVTLSLPAAPRMVEAGREWTGSDMLRDGFGLGVQVARNDAPLEEADLPAAATEVLGGLRNGLGHPDDATPTAPARVVTLQGAPVITQDFTTRTGLRFEHRLVFRPAAAVSVQVFRRADDTRLADLADRVAASVRAGP